MVLASLISIAIADTTWDKSKLCLHGVPPAKSKQKQKLIGRIQLLTVKCRRSRFGAFRPHLSDLVYGLWYTRMPLFYPPNAKVTNHKWMKTTTTVRTENYKKKKNHPWTVYERKWKKNSNSNSYGESRARTVCMFGVCASNGERCSIMVSCACTIHIYGYESPSSLLTL